MAKKQQPINQYAQQIEEKGLLVLEDISNFIPIGSPYISPYLLLVLNHSGSVKAEYDMQPFTFCKHDNAIIYPNHILLIQEVSPDYRCSCVAISESFLQRLQQLHPNHNRPEYHVRYSVHLNDNQFESIFDGFKVLRSISQTSLPDREEMLQLQMDIIARLAEAYILRNKQHVPQRQTKTQRLLSSFHTAVAAHYRESREVSFYAQQLCLSPKHFGAIVRQATGVKASEWIARYVIVQAKYLLKHQPHLSVQELSVLLGFSGQATFSRYFKTYTGYTPTEYREL